MYDRVADLPVHVEAVSTARHERDTTSGFTRVSTEVVLHGDGATGRGEDVTYDNVDHDRYDPTDFPLAGEYTVESFSSHLDDVDLFPEPTEREASRHYRRWAVESAALDLALRQANTTLGATLDRSYDPVRFVVSTSLSDEDESPSIDRVRTLLDRDPSLEFKLDPTADWSDELIADLAATDAVRVLDLKSYYEGTDVDNPADPALYERVLDGFPEAVVEDAKATDETRDLLAANRDRLSWDYPIIGIESIEALPFEPQWLNIKPSRFGTVESLLESLAYCEEHGISLYGGGQFELGVGRDQIQALASIFYPDGPNDVAPREFNDPDYEGDLPGSPIAVDGSEPGFGR
jgi:hypothetical protein